MKVQNWLYVTGAPRSGTTFLAKVLTWPLSVDYIHEPFNPDCGIPGINIPFRYLDPESESRTREHSSIEDLFDYRTKLRTGIYPEDGPGRRFLKRIVGSRGPFYYRLAKLNPFRKHVVVKDPIGCLLTEYLSIHHGVKPIILVRHPAAFVSSHMRLGWPARLGALRMQDELCQRYFPDNGSLADTGDPVRDLARLWAALHTVLADLIRRHPDWPVIRHEDLSTAPVDTFREVYARFALPWSDRIERRVRAFTTADNSSEARPNRVQDFRRDSSSLFALRLESLDETERARVFTETWPLARRWYPQASFGLEQASQRELAATEDS